MIKTDHPGIKIHKDITFSVSRIKAVQVVDVQTKAFGRNTRLVTARLYGETDEGVNPD